MRPSATLLTHQYHGAGLADAAKEWSEIAITKKYFKRTADIRIRISKVLIEEAMQNTLAK